MPLKNWFKRKSKKNVPSPDLEEFTLKEEETPSVSAEKIVLEKSASLETIETIAEIKSVKSSTSNVLETLSNLGKMNQFDSESKLSSEITSVQYDKAGVISNNLEPTVLSKSEIDVTLEPTEENPCQPMTCSKKCFTCGPPACERDDIIIQEYRQRKSAVSRKSVKWNAAIQNLILPTNSNSAMNIHVGSQPNNLVATPISDDETGSNLNLSDALAILMKQGVLGSDDDESGEEKVIKPRGKSWTSSSEEDNATFVIADLTRRDLRSEAAQRFKAKAKSELLTTKTALLMDECVNTSFSDIFIHKVKQEVIYKDSLIQLKRRSQLNDGSCTQFFALRSNIQLEPYLQSIRQHEHNKRIVEMKVTPALTEEKSSVIVPHQKGVLTLSKASFNEEDMIPETSSFPHFLPKVIDEERILAVIEIGSDKAILKSKADKGTSPTEDAAIQAPQVAEPPTTTCTRCRPNIDVRPPIISSNTLETLDETISEGDSVKGIPSMKRTTISMKNFSLDSEKPQSTDYSHSSSLIHSQKSLKVDSSMEAAPQELVFMLNILQPSKKLMEYSNASYTHVDKYTFMLKWNFLKTADAYAFSLDKGFREYKFHHVTTYEFNISPGVYLYLDRCSMAIELYSVSMLSETLIGKCSIKLGKAFADISKVYESRLEINNNDLCYCFSNLKPMQFGYLLCRFRLRGDQKKFDLCKPEKVIPSYIPPLVEPPTPRNIFSVPSTIFPKSGNPSGTIKQPGLPEHGNSIVSDAELQAFQDGLNLVLVRNKALRTTQEEITNELKDRTTWMHEELKWRLTLQENAILCGKDPGQVKWRQWKDDSTANVRYRPISHEEYFKDGLAHIEIEIMELILNGDSKVMNDDNITHLYIEFSFLNKSGREMETGSMRKPIEERPIRFKYKKVFDIRIEDDEAFMLAEVIKNNELITFTVISQPIEDMKEVQCCTDIGVANIVLFDLMQSRQNITIEVIPLLDSYKREVIIGTLKTRFTGVLAMRSMALHILTPDSFRIIR